MALRIGGPPTAGMMPQMSPGVAGQAVLPEDEMPMEDPIEEMSVEEPMGLEPGSVVEWIQEAIDLCKQTPHSDDLAYALEQALTLLIGPSAVGATEPLEPEPVDTISVEAPVEEPTEDVMVARPSGARRAP